MSKMQRLAVARSLRPKVHDVVIEALGEWFEQRRLPGSVHAKEATKLRRAKDVS